jgi:hypothetical protein
MKAIDITGYRFSRLIVRSRAQNIGRYTTWLCECNCGRFIIANTNNLRQGITKSCGCLKIERITALNKISDPKTVFWNKVKVDKDVCWLWLGAKNSGGYGSFLGTGAHVRSYEYAKGPIPEGLCVLHSCDNPSCVNPAHLFLGTKADNSQDAWKKGRNFFQKHPEARPKGENHANAKLNKKQIAEIRKLYASGVYYQKTLVKHFGVSQRTISLITRRESYV